MVTKSTSRKIPLEINQFLERTGITKRELAKELHVTSQSITDWTKPDGKAKNVTVDNAVRLSEIANDSNLTQTIGYYYLGLPKSMEGGDYSLDLSKLDDLRELEEDERDDLQDDKELRRILCKRIPVNESNYNLVLELAREQAEACIVNNQYLFALCELLNMSVMDLTEMYMPRWQKEGYFGGDCNA